MITCCFTKVKLFAMGCQISHLLAFKKSMVGYISVIPPRLQHSQAQDHGQPAPSTRLETSSAKTLMDIGTRRIFTEDHDIYRQSVRRFFQDEVAPHHKE